MRNRVLYRSCFKIGRAGTFIDTRIIVFWVFDSNKYVWIKLPGDDIIKSHYFNNYTGSSIIFVIDRNLKLLFMRLTIYIN